MLLCLSGWHDSILLVMSRGNGDSGMTMTKLFTGKQPLHLIVRHYTNQCFLSDVNFCVNLNQRGIQSAHLGQILLVTERLAVVRFNAMRDVHSSG